MKNYLLSRLQAIPWPPQLRDAIHSPWLPLALLLLALSTVFIFANDRGAFYRPGHHDVVTADFLSSTAVISPEQRFQSFFCRFRSVSGFTCAPYNRFPLGGYLLVKLFVLPFPDDLSAQIYSARILMLLAYAGAALLAYLSLCRLTGHRWIALIATLSVFASPYWLYYNDMVFFFGPSLFGVMLTFHAMVIFIQEGRFRQLLLKSCLALFLGWHSLALLLTFILIGLVSELLRVYSNPLEISRRLRIRAALSRLFRSRYSTLGVVTLLFGLAVLSFNFSNEYLYYHGERSLTELPSFQSMTNRISISPERPDPLLSDPLTRQKFLEEQFYRIGGMFTPYALPGYFNDLGQSPSGGLPRQFWKSARENYDAIAQRRLTVTGIILGLAATAAALLGLAFVSHKLLWATLSLFGFCWAFLARSHSAYHDFDGLLYTGIPLTACSLLLLYLNRPGGRRFIAAGVVAILLLFALSAFQMSQVGYATAVEQAQETAFDDFNAIRSLTRGSTVAYAGMLPEIRAPARYFLSRSSRSENQPPDFLVLPLSIAGVRTLTPENRRLFLYPGGPAAPRRYLDHILAQAGPPLINSTFSVHYYAGHPDQRDHWLFYVKNPCHRDDRQSPFFLQLTPANENDLPLDSRAYGFANLYFRFRNYVWLGGGEDECVIGRPLPNYPIAQITTGQYHPDGGVIWQGEAAIPPPR